MLERALNLPVVRDARAFWLGRRFSQCLQGRVADQFLELLLRFMASAVLVKPELRRHVRGFDARYAFRSEDGAIALGAVFAGGRMRVTERPPDAPHVTVVFRDGAALMRSLLSAEPDLLGSLLRQDVSFEGNLNYIYRLAYLARRLQRSALPEA